jgi:hypothetical protein
MQSLGPSLHLAADSFDVTKDSKHVSTHDFLYIVGAISSV